MALHGIMSIGIVIDNTNDAEPNDAEQNDGNIYVTSPTANIHENMIIANTDSISGGASTGIRVKRRLPTSILGGLGDDKQQERENSINSKINNKSNIVKKRVSKKMGGGIIDMRSGNGTCDKNVGEEIENVKGKVFIINTRT